MDFSLNDEQQATRDLAAQIFGDLSTPERHKELEAQRLYVDDKLWRAIADAGLLGLAIPEKHGGAGLGFLELALVLEELGRTTAKVPYLAATVLGALPIARAAPAQVQAEWLPLIAAGERVVTAALAEVANGASGASVSATREGDGFTLSGQVGFVPAGTTADAVLVPARTGKTTVGVFLVDPSLPSVVRERQDTTTGIPEAHLDLDRTPAICKLGDSRQGPALVDTMVLHATAALSAIAAGVCDRALRITAEYTKNREQFGRPIATFQAVSQRAGDAYIDTEAVRLTAMHAAWRINEGLPAAEAVAVAKFWAAEGGQRVVHAAQHLHGGVGVDRDYPLHRYFLWAKHLELALGGATHQLLKLGDLIAASTRHRS